MLKLLILDVDGVLTNGRKTYDSNGNIVSKEFCDKDWTAIKLFRASGTEVCFLTGDPFNIKIAENRNIDCIVNRTNGNHIDKADFLPEILKKYNCSIEHVGVLADDIWDLKLLKSVQYSFCPFDAVEELKEFCIILNKNGGENLLMELYNKCKEYFLIEKIEHEKLMNKIYSLDQLEKF